MKTFIFDLDDTLIYTSYHFVIPTLKVCKEILSRIDDTDEEISKLEDIINMPLDELKKTSLSKIRPTLDKVPFIQLIFDNLTNSDAEHVKQLIANDNPNPFGLGGMADTYYKQFEFFLKDYDCKIKNTDMDLIYHMAFETYFIAKDFKPGAEEVLNFLKKKGDNLILMTKGDPEWQQKKIESHNLQDWFSETHIVSTKTSFALSNIIKYGSIDHTYKVGNSFKSDIMPALEVGIKSIYIPFETWAFEGKEQENLDNEKVWNMNCLHEIMYNYHML